MAQRQPLWTQRIFECRPVDASLNSRGTGDTIDLDDLIQSSEIDRHDTRVSIADAALHPADDAGTAAEGNRRNILAAAPVEQIEDGLFAFRKGHPIRRLGKVPTKCANEIPIRSPEAVAGTFTGVIGEHRSQSFGTLDTRGAEIEFLYARRREHFDFFHSEAPSQAGRNLPRRGLIGSFTLAAPSPEFELWIRHSSSITA